MFAQVLLKIYIKVLKGFQRKKITYFKSVVKVACILKFIPNNWRIFIQNDTQIFCLTLHRFLTNIYTDK